MRSDSHLDQSPLVPPIEPLQESQPLAAAPPDGVISRSGRTRTAAGRAALFFCIAGVLAIVDSVFLPAAHAHELIFIALGTLDLAIAVVLWLLPWSRWPERALFVIVPLALVVIGLFYQAGATPPVVYPIFFILLFIWVGLSLPPSASLLLTPLTAAAYVLPLLLPGPHAAPIDSALVAVPVCIVIGEVIAHVMHRLRMAQDRLEQQVAERTAELRAANTALQHELVERTQAEAALRASERSYRLLMEQASDGILVCDPQGWFRDVNAQACALLGYTREELLQLHVTDIMVPEDLARPINWEALRSGAVFIRELSVRRKDRTILPVEVSVKQLGDERVQTIIRDITERKRMEATLAAERASLARRVEERTADLRAANAQLAHAARLKDEFLASMSHELRTPLNTILGMAETLQEGIFGAVNQQQTDALRHIEESGRHLLALINDILDLSKVEAGKLDLNIEEVVIAHVCEASVRLVKQLAAQKRLTVSLNIDSAVSVLQADVRRLKQILVNLLSNAVKFTPEGGAIGLEVLGDAAAQRVHLTVWDTGIGIAADDLTRLFQPFVQLDSRLARQYNGTGLGLALVQRMAALHGGSVTVESTLGQGSRFTVTLPWASALAMSDPLGSVDSTEPSLVPGAATRRALVIEDTPTAAAQLARYLRDLGAEASVHPHGVGALEAALAVRPDVILLDIQLPDISGWDVLAQLKADPRVNAIPVVVVSVIDDRPYGMARGAAACLVKPIARQQLQEALDTIQSGGMSHTESTVPVILLAEDEETNVYILSTYLAANGYQVVVARNGAEALERAHDSAPALILMDIQMPGMDGLEAIRRLRAGATLTAIPIIAMTALAMAGDRERCLAAGANDYLSKPVSLKGLITAIEAHIHHLAASSETVHDPHEYH